MLDVEAGCAVEGMPSKRRDLVPGRSDRAVATTGRVVVRRRCWVKERPMPREEGVTRAQAMVWEGGWEDEEVVGVLSKCWPYWRCWF